MFRITALIFCAAMFLLVLQGCGDLRNTFGNPGECYSCNGEVKENLSDEEICEVLSQDPTATGILKLEYEYLCSGGLQELRDNESVYLKDKDSGGISTIASGGYLSVEAKMSSAQNMYRTYCSDFPTFRAIAPDAFKDLDRIDTWDFSDLGCQFHFHGKKMLFWKPEFKGEVVYNSELSPDVFIFIYYLKESVSLVRDTRNIVVSVRNGDNIDVFSVSHIEVENKGFHSQVKASGEETALKLRDGISAHMNEF